MILLRRMIRNQIIATRNVLSRRLSINFSSNSNRELRQISRPNGHRIAWNPEVLRKLMPFTAELVNSKGMLFDNIAVGFCHPHTAVDINPETGVGEKRFEDSWLEMILPLSDHGALRETLIRVDQKNIRYGKLFEMLDALAADVAYRHTGGLHDNAKPISIVTASVDGLSAFRNINAFYDLKLQGYLSFTGSSSMEVCIDIISTSPDGTETMVGCTQFIMVARDAVSGKASKVHSLQVSGENSEELKIRFEQAKNRSLYRKEKAKSSLSIAAPKPEEIQSLHELYLHSKQMKAQKDKILQGKTSTSSVETPRMKWMQNTLFKNALLMHPQDRNIHGKIFGGYLMKTAMELSWVVAKCFIGKDNFPVFLSAEKIEFIHPVSIGTIVEFSGRVVHSTEGMFVIQVLANEIDPDSGSKLATNKLTYIYQASATPECHYSEGAEHLGVTPVKVPYLMPREYEEFIAHLEGKRALDHYIESKGKPAGC